jgi:ferritin-like metal-binding protein YciE
MERIRNSKQEENEHSPLEKFFIEELKDIYWVEKHLVKVLPVMYHASSTGDLKRAISNHLTQTKGHITRLEEVFEILGEKPEGKKCEAMEGITKEGELMIEETNDESAIRDVGIIMASQKVEHYEIATYGSLIQLAKSLGKYNIARLLDDILSEEKRADAIMTEIAESHVNAEATQE